MKSEHLSGRYVYPYIGGKGEKKNTVKKKVQSKMLKMNHSIPCLPTDHWQERGLWNFDHCKAYPFSLSICAFVLSL